MKRTWLITGVSSGFGYEMAKHLAKIEEISINDIDQQMSELLSHVKKPDRCVYIDKTKTASSPQGKKWPPSR